MQDALNKFDPMPVAFGPVKRQAPKPTADELRVKELRDFETMTDLPEVRFAVLDFGAFADLMSPSATDRLLHLLRADIQRELVAFFG